MKRVVLKVGGTELAELTQRVDASFVAGLVDALRALWQQQAVVLVHGGGKAIAYVQERLGLRPRFVDGLRITDDESLDVAEMVLSGWVNKRLVARLVAAGVPAVGLSGVDGGILRVVKRPHPTHDLGWVGEVTEAHVEEVIALLERGVTPVLSPISLGMDGHTYNVNADHAAAALARALEADELVFVSNVPGVLVHEGDKLVRIPALTPTEAEALIASGEISGGMIPKVRSALGALTAGVRVRITDLAGLVAQEGTFFYRSER